MSGNDDAEKSKATLHQTEKKLDELKAQKPLAELGMEFLKDYKDFAAALWNGDMQGANKKAQELNADAANLAIRAPLDAVNSGIKAARSIKDKLGL